MQEIGWIQQLAKLKLVASQQERHATNKSEIQLAIYNQQMMPRLPGCLFKFIQKQPPDTRGVHSIGRQLAIQFISDWCKKTEKVFLEISHKIHKENTCVRISFSNFIKRHFCRDFFKIDFGTCFPVNFAKFLRTPFSQLLACSQGDCYFFLLIFISPPFHLFVASQLAIGTLYILCESVLRFN